MKEQMIPGIYIIQHFKQKEMPHEKGLQVGVRAGGWGGTDLSDSSPISYSKKYLDGIKLRND